MARRTLRRVAILAVLALAQVGVPTLATRVGAPALAQTAPAPAVANVQTGGGVASVAFRLVGSTNLASPGLDGQVRPRGQNGDVATLKNFAYVGGGALFHGAQSTSGRVCTDYGGVKVVDLTNPAQPAVRSIINIEDTKGVGTSTPFGSPRRGLRLDNVSVSAGAVDALSVATPSFTGDLLAIATQRCEPSFFDGARIELWNVSNPAAPARLGVFDPELVANPNCNPTCPPSQTPNGAWGIFEDVRMFTRGNRLLAVATTPFSIGNSGQVSFFGDFRLIDLTDPRNPLLVGTFPPVSVGQDTLNGCRKFLAGRAAAPTPDGNSAILSFYDGASVFEGNKSSAVFKLDLDNLPRFVPGSEPPRFTPSPPKFDFPIDPDVEVNAADVAPFTSTDGRLLVALSEDDIDPAKSSITIQLPGAPGAGFEACEQPMARKLYEFPGQQLAGDVVYVGRGCPASPLGLSTNQAADEYLGDPRGRIALMDSGSGPFDGCSSIERANRAIAAGATAVVQNGGSNTLQSANNGPPGGNPAQPTMVIPTDAMVRMQLVPNTLLTGTTFPTAWERTTTTNATVAPLAAAVTAATNASPVSLTTAVHGLATGDRVAVAGIVGNTAANGSFPVTVTSPTVFTLDGSAGNGAYVGGGYVVRCPAGATTCPAPPTRTDFARFRSVANTTDPVARGQVNAANRFDVVAGRNYDAGATLEVEAVTAGAFRAAVTWFDAAGNALPDSEIGALAASGPRTRVTRVVTAPAGAVKGGAKFEWTGAGAAGTAHANSFTVVPSSLSATLKDGRGEWGAQRLLDFSADPPREVGVYRSPNSTVWPPPNNGLYGPRLTEPFGPDVLFTTWLSDGLRVLDVSDPSKPREIASFVPPDVADPSSSAGAGPTDRAGTTGNLQRGQSWPNRALVTGVDVIPDGPSSGHVVVSDINAGLYVLRFEVVRGAPGGSYWSVAADGGVFAFGDARFLGSTGALRLARPVVAMAATPSGNGYWLVASDGGVFAFGDARFLGSTGAMRLNQPMVGMTPTPTGNGYWLVAADGGVFAFGDARFLGSTGATRLARPIVGLTASPTGNGYRLVASDGGVFAFGDARFLGSTGALRLARPVVAMAATPTGNGYWLVAADGGIFAFGDARFLGSTGALRLAQPVVGMSRSPSGNGYWLVASDGGVFAFGDARFQGSAGGTRLARPMVGMASVR